jgi:hypothetical protein
VDAAAHAADLAAQLVCKYIVSPPLANIFTETKATNVGDIANKYSKHLNILFQLIMIFYG